MCRYAAGDKVESWLLELLCLNAAEHVPKLPARLPHPTECDLFYINRDTLFSYHKVRSMHQFLFYISCDILFSIGRWGLQIKYDAFDS